MPSALSLSLSKPNIVKACSHATTTVSVPENLNEKFSRKGTKYSQSDNIPMVQLIAWIKGSLMLAEWTVKDVDSDAIDALQVELSCTNGALNLICVVTLHPTCQDVPFTVLNNKLSRVYATCPKERVKAFYNMPPSKYETLDQEYFICTGPDSMLVPLIVKPGEDWRGVKVVEHDNL
ncbi:hypothetical protein FEM48_ZijujUnG0129000 [Ziziphus jujuba var. spinosa]|uniref:Uncharacterized protein n=1 Tax=Ziziphus jujuba var. spinosa TaxID=714518 RepID=A0A978U7Q1_ZIZJJ|nr:hypothetical protein FEM48_ZijujUnG0129000 [Ziziphus jujuba var. spinosa]